MKRKTIEEYLDSVLEELDTYAEASKSLPDDEYSRGYTDGLLVCRKALEDVYKRLDKIDPYNLEGH